MRELTRLIKEDMKPALGVTEPGAIAYAVASAKSHVNGEVKKVHVALNSGMYKNAFTCGIPNSSRFGNLYAAALGAVAADAAKDWNRLRILRRRMMRRLQRWWMTIRWKWCWIILDPRLQ